MVEIVKIGDDELRSLFSRSEGHFLDFKSKLIAPAKLSRSISAFANADGGEILVGIDENYDGLTWQGFERA